MIFNNEASRIYYMHLFMSLILTPGSEVIKLFHAELSTKFQLLIKTKIPKNKEVSCFKPPRCYIFHAYKC